MLYANSAFSRQFCHDLVEACLRTIAKHGSLNLVAMPGAGVTFFVRQLEHLSPDVFVSVNSFELHEFSKTALYNQLARKLGLAAASADQVDLTAIAEALKAKAGPGQKVVLVFNRFDRLGPILDQGFYENLHYLYDVCEGCLAMLLVTAWPLTESTGSGLQDLLHQLHGVLYFPGYTSEDLREILLSSGVNAADIEPEALALSGGHHALVQLLMRCQNLDNALADPLVELLIKDLYHGLSARRRRDIDAVAAGRHKSVDPALCHLGYVAERDGKNAAFTPLLAEYARAHSQAYLPVRERRLLNLLKRNAGCLVPKQEIFDTVWREADGIATDWALNALVYRLRRHSAFDAQRYTIESHKKQGYVLYDNRHRG